MGNHAAAVSRSISVPSGEEGREVTAIGVAEDKGIAPGLVVPQVAVKQFVPAGINLDQGVGRMLLPVEQMSPLFLANKMS